MVKETGKNIFGCFGIVITWAIVLVAAVLMNGWALATLWGWFIVPVFDAPRLRIVEAIGVSSVVGILFSSRRSERKEEQEFWEWIAEALSYAVLGALAAVGIGWVVKGFM